MSKLHYFFVVLTISITVGGFSSIVTKYYANSPSDRVLSAGELEWLATCFLVSPNALDGCRKAVDELAINGYFTNGAQQEVIQQ